MECEKRILNKPPFKKPYKFHRQFLFLIGILFLFFLNLRTSVAHMDSPGVVEIGLMQMLSLVVNNGLEDELDVLLFTFKENILITLDTPDPCNNC